MSSGGRKGGKAKGRVTDQEYDQPSHGSEDHTDYNYDKEDDEYTEQTDHKAPRQSKKSKNKLKQSSNNKASNNNPLIYENAKDPFYEAQTYIPPDPDPDYNSPMSAEHSTATTSYADQQYPSRLDPASVGAGYSGNYVPDAYSGQQYSYLSEVPGHAPIATTSAADPYTDSSLNAPGDMLEDIQQPFDELSSSQKAIVLRMLDRDDPKHRRQKLTGFVDLNVQYPLIDYNELRRVSGNMQEVESGIDLETSNGTVTAVGEIELKWTEEGKKKDLGSGKSYFYVVKGLGYHVLVPSTFGTKDRK